MHCSTRSGKLEWNMKGSHTQTVHYCPASFALLLCSVRRLLHTDSSFQSSAGFLFFFFSTSLCGPMRASSLSLKGIRNGKDNLHFTFTVWFFDWIGNKLSPLRWIHCSGLIHGSEFTAGMRTRLPYGERKSGALESLVKGPYNPHHSALLCGIHMHLLYSPAWLRTAVAEGTNWWDWLCRYAVFYQD